MKPGDLVRLKSGGPPMTGTKLLDDEVKCMWFESGVVLRQEVFPSAALVDMEPAAGPEAKVFDPDATVPIPALRGEGDIAEILAHSMETQKKAALMKLEENKLLRGD